jgi:hypothetical protein
MFIDLDFGGEPFLEDYLSEKQLMVVTILFLSEHRPICLMLLPREVNINVY